MVSQNINFESISHGYMPGSKIDQEPRDEEGRDFLVTTSIEGYRCLIHVVQASYSAANRDALEKISLFPLTMQSFDLL